MQQNDRILSFLLGLYIVSLAFTDVWILPWLGRKVQPPEIVFLLISLLVIRRWRSRPRQSFRLWRLDAGLLFFLPVFGLAAMLSPGKYAYLEVLGLGYLWLLYWVFSRYMSRKEEAPASLLNAIFGLAGFLGIISIFSFILMFLGVAPDGYLAEWKLIPYVGPVIRVSGFAVTPNLWATAIEFSILILFGVLLYLDNKWPFIFILLLLLAALLLTFSKSIVAFIAVLGFMLPRGIQIKRRWRITFVGIGLGALLFYVFTSHVLLLSEQDANYAILKEKPYLVRQSLLHLPGFEFVKTTNLELKEQAMQAFRSSHGLGVGGGQFINFISAQQEKGAYPAYLPVYEPHSTYFGLLAEAGILGLMALAWAMFAIIKIVREESKLSLSGIDRALFWGAKAYLLLLMIEAVAVSVLNFRTLWVALGIIGAIYMKNEREENVKR